MCMKFYDDTKPLYLETDASGVGLGVDTTTDVWRDSMPERHSTRQHHSVPHCICQQKPNRCRAHDTAT